MIAIDTNVLLRIAVDDDADQAARARALFTMAERSGDEIVVSSIVMAEVVWAMRQVYRQPRAVIAGFLEKLMRTPRIRVVDRDVVRAAVTDYAAGGADFADYLIAAYATREGAEAVYTFDRSAAAEDRFLAVP